ncbi:GD20986 [Drosophila simulans]|uniref:GD20986 n=1 Tax=Drosophila simulans TaxID=7240 RepID=B4R0S2_DROSI|nr:GD20986 [Drosophila simulans]
MWTRLGQSQGQQLQSLLCKEHWGASTKTIAGVALVLVLVLVLVPPEMAGKRSLTTASRFIVFDESRQTDNMPAICKGLTHSSRSNESKLNGGTRTADCESWTLRRTLYSMILEVCLSARSGQVGLPDNVNVVEGEAANAARQSSLLQERTPNHLQWHSSGLDLGLNRI